MVLQVTSYKIMRLVICASISVGVLSASYALPLGVGVANAQSAVRKMNGFEVSGRFLEEWSRQGSDEKSIYVNGLPITSRRPEISMEDGRSYETQWFERARYELHPGNQKPYDVLLGRLGSSTAEGRSRVDPATGRAANPADQPFVGIDKPADADGKSKVWFVETKHTISGKVLEYWNSYGGLPQFGFPLSEPFQEVSQADGKTYTVQYFERNRMELHPEKAAPYDVELGLLGVEQYKLQAVSADQLPVAPAKDARSTKDTITVGTSREPSNLTFADTSSVSGRIRALVEDGLVGRDDNDNHFPLNAWYVPTLENGGARFVGDGGDRYLQVKYKLRQGIKWSDGKELTSNDAIFAYKLMLDPTAPVPNRLEYQKLQNIDNPGKYTIIYNYRSFNQVSAFYDALPAKEKYEGKHSFLRPFVDQKKPVVSRTYSEIGIIYPEHVLGKIAPARIAEGAWASAPIGTGPWKVESWTKGREIVLVPNEHYSLTAKPLIRRFIIKFLSDSSSLFGPPRLGALDMITGDAFSIPPPKVEDARVMTRPSSTWEHLDFYFGYHPFQEKPVREAIFIGINRQRIVDEVFGGAVAVLKGVVPPEVYYSIENPHFARNYPDIVAKYKLPNYEYNPDRANLLLDQAGWTRGADGIRTKGGIKLSFEYGTVTQAVRQLTQARVSADLKAIGVEAIPKNYSSSLFFDNSAESPRANATIKLAQFSWVATRDSDFGTWICPVDPYDASSRPPYGWSCLLHRDLDNANATFNTEIDPVTQLSAAAEAQAIVMKEIITIPLFQRPNVELVKDGLANYKLSYHQMNGFWNARQWYFK